MNAYQHAAFGLVFDQLLNLFKGRKNFPEGMRGGRYFYGNSRGVVGLTFPCKNGKSDEQHRTPGMPS